ncbi:MAG: PQQ-binding-like beta-propeller repeat protein [Thermoplasmata archaeon]|nr:PQQ-binding-like beta-propeller repeat protein [Thermoplasmata archaeon]
MPFRRRSPGRLVEGHGTAIFLGPLVVAALTITVGSLGSVEFPSIYPQQSTSAMTVPPLCLGSDWPTYLDGLARDSAAVGERSLSPTSAPSLAELWNFSTGAPVGASAAIVHGVVYIGSWNGDEYALNASSGGVLWKTPLGTDPNSTLPLGVTSSATVSAGSVFVGGGNAFFYVLNATNGHVRWKVNVGNTTLGYYPWSSPLVYGGFVYYGISSGNDASVPGQLDQISVASHRLVHVLNTTSNRSNGATIWTSPAVNAGTNTVFVTTGNPPPPNASLGESILALNASTLAVRSSWAVPPSEQTVDGDFGTTPLLLTTSTHVPLVVASNKNGILYAWNQSNLSRGPVWNLTTALPSPPAGSPELGPVSFGGGRLYVGTSTANVSGTLANGSVRAVSPTNGRTLWVDALTSGPVKGAPTYADGVVAFAAGTAFEVVNASNGHKLYSFVIPSKPKFWGYPSVSRGEIIVGNSLGEVYAFGLTSCAHSFGPAGMTRPAELIAVNPSRH